jgi:hypothetical protein
MRGARAAELRRARWISGVAWLVSWVLLYGAIYVWQHVTPSLRLNPPAPLPGLPPPRPGFFLLAVLVVAPSAPLVFLALLLGAQRHQRR